MVEQRVDKKYINKLKENVFVSFATIIETKQNTTKKHKPSEDHAGISRIMI